MTELARAAGGIMQVSIEIGFVTPNNKILLRLISMFSFQVMIKSYGPGYVKVADIYLFFSLFKTPVEALNTLS